METTRPFSEHQLVLQQQEDLVNDVEKVTDMFSETEVLYSLQTADELLYAWSRRMEKLNMHLMEYKRISSLMKPECAEEIHSLFSNHENHVGQIEKDANGNLHCGDCLVPYNYCKDLVGKKVRLSLITLNSNPYSKNFYPTFAKHIYVVE